MAVIRTFIQMPSRAPDLIERTNLDPLRARMAAAPLTVIHAPAGAGKSVLMAQWARDLAETGAHVAWLSATAGLDGVGLLDYLGAALAAADPMLADLPSGLDDWLAAVTQRLDGGGAPMFLFIDAAERLDGMAAPVLARLADCAGDNLHLVIAGRSLCGLPLGRARALGRLAEIGPADLQFSPAEAALLLGAERTEALGADGLARMMVRTEGWAMGLKLARQALSRRGPGGIAAALPTGRWRALSDFFAEDVLAPLRPGVREFLLETSILNRLSPELCNAVTGRHDGRDMLDILERDALFLIPRDQERGWYRYHPLFGEFLRRRLTDLDAGAAGDLHRRASQWFAGQDLLDEALGHASQTGDMTWLAQTIDQYCDKLTYSGRIGVAVKYAQQVPESVLAHYPRAILTLAWRRMRQLKLREAKRLIDLARARIDELAAAGAPADEIEALRLVLMHREMTLDAAGDNAQKVEEECVRLLAAFSDEQSYLICTLYGNLLSAQRDQFRFGDFNRIEAAAMAMLDHSQYDFAAISLKAATGPSLAMLGKTGAAIDMLDSALGEATRFGVAGLGALPALPLADLAYETNDLARARQLIDNYLPEAREWGFVDQLTAGYLVQARLLFANGDMDGALRALDDALSVALQCGLERLRAAIAAEQVRIFLRSGQPARAAEIAAQAGLPAEAADMMPKLNSTTRQEMVAAAWVRLAMQRNDLFTALEVIKRWRGFCVQRGAVRAAVRWKLLAAQCLALQGEGQAALRSLREALSDAAPGRFVRAFIDEGALIKSMLFDCCGETAATPTDYFAREVLAAFGATSWPGHLNGDADEYGLTGRLTTRELEVLGLVEAGMRNREIGDRLGLTEGTVKWYMQQIYDKLGVRRRPQVIHRARQLGLLG